MNKRILKLLPVIFSIIAVSFSCKNEIKENRLATRLDTISYCTGVMLGSNLRKDGFDTINSRLLSKGLLDFVDHKKLIIDEKRSKKILYDYRGEMLEKRLLAKFKDNKSAGEKFLEENKKQKGVITLPSGLQYKILKAGEGPRPGPRDLVLVHYQGKLIDGTVFEKHMTGEPVPFFVNRVIKGWKEALQLMPQGSKWRLYIPYQLGYGTEYNPNSIITPYSTLIFDIELLKVKHYQ